MASGYLCINIPIINGASADLAVVAKTLVTRAPRASPTDNVSRQQFDTRSYDVLNRSQSKIRPVNTFEIIVNKSGDDGVADHRVDTTAMFSK